MGLGAVGLGADRVARVRHRAAPGAALLVPFLGLAQLGLGAREPAERGRAGGRRLERLTVAPDGVLEPGGGVVLVAGGERLLERSGSGDRGRHRLDRTFTGSQGDEFDST